MGTWYRIQTQIRAAAGSWDRIPSIAVFESVQQTKISASWKHESTEQTNTKSQTVAVTKTGIKY